MLRPRRDDSRGRLVPPVVPGDADGALRSRELGLSLGLGTLRNDTSRVWLCQSSRLQDGEWLRLRANHDGEVADAGLATTLAKIGRLKEAAEP